MRVALVVLLAISLVLSLGLNVYYWAETTQLNQQMAGELGQNADAQLPPRTMTELQGNFQEVMSRARSLKRQYEDLEEQLTEAHAEAERYKRQADRYEAKLLQIQREAERAQTIGTITTLLRLIFSLV